jgi:phage major head subunit gpT-like protein
MVISTSTWTNALKIAFNKAMGEIQALGFRAAMDPIFMRVESKLNQETYDWFGDIPEVREWIGDKEAGALTEYDFTIKNRPFYSAFSVHKHALDDDVAGLIRPRVNGLVQAIKGHVADLIIELITGGESGLAYDGAAFFSSRTAPNDNLLDGTGITLATLQTDLFSARAAMLRFESDAGRVLGLEMDTVLVPAALEGLMLQAVHSNLAGASGEEIHNPLSRWIKSVIAIPDLDDTDTTDWYGLCTSAQVKPFVYQDREKAVPVVDDSEVAKNGKYIFSVEMRGNAGYGLPILALKMVNS